MAGGNRWKLIGITGLYNMFCKNNIFIFIFADLHVVVRECGFFFGLHAWIKIMDLGREDQGQCRQAGEHVAARYAVPHLRSIRRVNQLVAYHSTINAIYSLCSCVCVDGHR